MAKTPHLHASAQGALFYWTSPRRLVAAVAAGSVPVKLIELFWPLTYTDCGLTHHNPHLTRLLGNCREPSFAEAQHRA